MLAPTKKKPKNYVNNNDFYAAIVKYREEADKAKEAGLPQPIIPNYIGECILKIAEKIATRPCFSNYSFKNEMISDSVINAVAAVTKFDINRSSPDDPAYGKNAFSYFTTVINNSFIGRINIEEKNRYIACKALQNSLTDGDDCGLFVGSDGKNAVNKKMYDNVNDFIARFEEKEKRKRENRKLKKAAQQQETNENSRNN